MGIAAHVLDSIGSKKVKPWGNYFSKKQLWILSLSTLIPAYAIGIYYMVIYVPLLWVIAISEGFFVFAYNMEWFNRKFHTDGWFAFSWGSLPLLAGYIIQTNDVSLIAGMVATATGFVSYVEIKTSRPYKELKRGNYDRKLTQKQLIVKMNYYERVLKSLSIGTISVIVIFGVLRGIIL